LFETDLPDESKVTKGNVKFTEKKVVPSRMLSEDIVDMCYDADVFWME